MGGEVGLEPTTSGSPSISVNVAVCAYFLKGILCFICGYYNLNIYHQILKTTDTLSRLAEKNVDNVTLEFQLHDYIRDYNDKYLACNNLFVFQGRVSYWNLADNGGTASKVTWLTGKKENKENAYSLIDCKCDATLLVAVTPYEETGSPFEDRLINNQRTRERGILIIS